MCRPSIVYGGSARLNRMLRKDHSATGALVCLADMAERLHVTDIRDGKKFSAANDPDRTIQDTDARIRIESADSTLVLDAHVPSIYSNDLRSMTARSCCEDCD